jgi:mRNA interferase HigB
MTRITAPNVRLIDPSLHGIIPGLGCWGKHEFGRPPQPAIPKPTELSAPQGGTLTVSNSLPSSYAKPIRGSRCQDTVDIYFPIWELILVRAISRRAIREFTRAHPDAIEPLAHWYVVSRRASWSSLADVRRDFRHADIVGKYTVFNIGGNKFRLIATVKYKWQVVYIRQILTRADYDEGAWL